MAGPRNEPPAAAEFGQWRARLARDGVSPQDVNAILGTNVEGRTREQIMADWIQWQKTLPKAV